MTGRLPNNNTDPCREQKTEQAGAQKTPRPKKGTGSGQEKSNF